MGTGESGTYYTSHGSAPIHHEAIIHSIEGEYTHEPKTGRPLRLKNGGHGQAAMNLMDAIGIEYHVVKTWPNGVRIGYVPNHKMKWKRRGTNQAWFPRGWSTMDIVKAGEHIVSLKTNQGTADGETMWGTYKGVHVGVKRTNGRISTIFPDIDQSGYGV